MGPERTSIAIEYIHECVHTHNGHKTGFSKSRQVEDTRTKTKQANTYTGQHARGILRVVVSINNVNRDANQWVSIFIWMRMARRRRRGEEDGRGWQAASLVAGKNTSRVG